MVMLRRKIATHLHLYAQVGSTVSLRQYIAQLVVAGDYVSSFFARCSVMTKGIYYYYLKNLFKLDIY